MDKEELQEKMQKWFYHLTKRASNPSYREFLDSLNISCEEYDAIKKKVENTLSVKLYI